MLLQVLITIMHFSLHYSCISFIIILKSSLKLFLFFVQDISKGIELFFDAVNVAFVFFIHVLQLIFIWVPDIDYLLGMLNDDIILLLQVWFYCLDGFASCLDLMLAMGSVDCALWTNGRIAVETKIRQFFFRVGLTHIRRRTSFLWRHVIGVIIAGLRDGSVGLGNWGCVCCWFILLVWLGIKLFGISRSRGLFIRIIVRVSWVLVRIFGMRVHIGCVRVASVVKCTQIVPTIVVPFLALSIKLLILWEDDKLSAVP